MMYYAMSRIGPMLNCNNWQINYWRMLPSLTGQIKPSFVDQVKGLFGKRTTTETNSPSQQLIAWVQQNNVQALYNGQVIAN